MQQDLFLATAIVMGILATFGNSKKIKVARIVVYILLIVEICLLPYHIL